MVTNSGRQPRRPCARQEQWEPHHTDVSDVGRISLDTAKPAKTRGTRLTSGMGSQSGSGAASLNKSRGWMDCALLRPITRRFHHATLNPRSPRLNVPSAMRDLRTLPPPPHLKARDQVPLHRMRTHRIHPIRHLTTRSTQQIPKPLHRPHRNRRLYPQTSLLRLISPPTR